jgi:hypothetical protein
MVYDFNFLKLQKNYKKKKKKSNEPDNIAIKVLEN